MSLCPLAGDLTFLPWFCLPGLPLVQEPGGHPCLPLFLILLLHSVAGQGQLLALPASTHFSIALLLLGPSHHYHLQNSRPPALSCPFFKVVFQRCDSRHAMQLLKNEDTPVSSGQNPTSLQ